jgi:transcriptional regulator with XRE-family HTH domain
MTNPITAIVDETGMPEKVNKYAKVQAEKGGFYIKMGNNIAKHRKALKITQERLAEKLGISRVALTNIENGKQRLAVHMVNDICMILKTTIDTLINGKAVCLNPPLTSEYSQNRVEVKEQDSSEWNAALDAAVKVLHNSRNAYSDMNTIIGNEMVHEINGIIEKLQSLRK